MPPVTAVTHLKKLTVKTQPVPGPRHPQGNSEQGSAIERQASMVPEPYKSLMFQAWVSWFSDLPNVFCRLSKHTGSAAR